MGRKTERRCGKRERGCCRERESERDWGWGETLIYWDSRDGARLTTFRTHGEGVRKREREREQKKNIVLWIS